jgi:morphogenetic protein associated with SpoVID
MPPQQGYGMPQQGYGMPQQGYGMQQPQMAPPLGYGGGYPGPQMMPQGQMPMPQQHPGFMKG